MRIAALVGALALAACEAPEAGSRTDAGWSGSGGYGQTRPAARDEMQAEVEHMHAEWMDSRRRLAEARSEAMSAGRPISPEVDAEVTEVLARDIDAPSDEVRLQRLSDAVSDARRLAELVSPG